MSTTKKSYPSDVTDVEWEFLLPYLTLMREDAPQREYTLRDLFDAIRYVVKTGCQWRYLPHEFPPWAAVYQQARRWLAARVFEDAAHDLRGMIRLAIERGPHPAPTLCISGATERRAAKMHPTFVNSTHETPSSPASPPCRREKYTARR